MLTKQELEKLYELTYKYGWLTAIERQQAWLPDRAYMEKARLESDINKLLDRSIKEFTQGYLEYFDAHNIDPKEIDDSFSKSTFESDEEYNFYMCKVILNDLLKVEPGDPIDYKVEVFQTALTNAHNNGLMLEYLIDCPGDYTEIIELLDNLSGGLGKNEWDKELQQATGINLEEIFSVSSSLRKVIRILSQHHPMYLYHVTMSINIPTIAERGLDKDVPMNIRDPSHEQFDIENKIFFTDAKGISEWVFYFRERMQGKVCILRVNINNIAIGSIYIDEVGTEDVGFIGIPEEDQYGDAGDELNEEYKDVFAYYVEQDIPPEHIEIYDEESRSWIPIQELAIRDY